MYEFDNNPITVHTVLSKLFNTQEVSNLCFNMGVSYENFGGSGHGGKATEITTWAFRHKRQVELWNLMATQRRTQVQPTNGFVLPEPEPVQEPVVQKEEFVALVIAEMEELITQMQGTLFELKMAATGQMRAK